MRTVMTAAFLALFSLSYGQTYRIRGEVLDTEAHPLSSSTTVLLDPADSTLLFFAVTGSNGRFELSNVKGGNYLLQISLIGYSTLYRTLTVPAAGGDDLGSFILPVKVYDVEGVTVTRERIPVRIKQDTIEYDAKAFKVKPDAVAEDLIKKMPGIEVDRAGNIKALGEDVGNILVDGKEFFGSDPKMATRNLPADAIDKVQLFDKQSDEADFTGIDDGERDPTLNFVLDEKKKKGIFGEISAAGGTGDHVAGTAKAYRFSDKIQLAALGMFNNINQYGFSLNDYIGFNGGISSLTSGNSRILIGNGSSFPVNFGQPVYGNGSNGAAGINFSLFRQKRNRFFISYIGSGSDRTMNDISRTEYYLPGEAFLSNATEDQIKRDTVHSLNMGLRKMIGSRQNIILNGTLSYNHVSNPLSSVSESLLNDAIVNQMERTISEMQSGLSGSFDFSHLLKIDGNTTVLKTSAQFSYAGSKSENRINNLTTYYDPYVSENTSQFYDLESEKLTGSASLSLIRKVSKLSSLNFSLEAKLADEDLKRRQGAISAELIPDEDLSPDFIKREKSLHPGISWKRNTTKSNLLLSLGAILGEFGTTLNDEEEEIKGYNYFRPGVRWEYNYRTGRRFMFDYSASVNTPQASLLLPVINNLNSLSLFYGNRELRPEYIHASRLSWWLFDQFSFTTLMTGLNLRYTRDKISYARITDDNLTQTITPVNVRGNMNAGLSIDFTTPVKPLGVMIELSVNENYERGEGLVNNVENVYTNNTHSISLTINNRKKDKWDIETGSAFNLTTTRYSVQNTLNNTYSDISWFGEVRYTPGKHFSFMMSADLTGYSAKRFDNPTFVPLTGAEMNWYFMKNQRATLTLSGVDLLNRNSGIEHNSDMNYLVEHRYATIGRYLMLSFKYRLNRMGDINSGVDVRVRKR